MERLTAPKLARKLLATVPDKLKPIFKTYGDLCRKQGFEAADASVFVYKNYADYAKKNPL